MGSELPNLHINAMVRALTLRTVGHCAQEVRSSMKTRRAILVTWNPDKFVWGGGYLDAVEQTAQGIGVVGDWSTGNRTGGVSARGPPCRSSTTSDVHPPHWVPPSCER